MTSHKTQHIVQQVLCLFFMLISFSGCVQLIEGRPAGPWHDAYNPIEDTASEAFITQAWARLEAEFGGPVIPVQQVLLRRSKKSGDAAGYRIAENFSLAECVDPSNGVFAIYLSLDPGNFDYYGLLGHECGHLFNPYIFDWYMEGLVTRFSEQLCAEVGVPWGHWQRRFKRNRRDPYALSYRMMCELQAHFPQYYPSIPRFTAPGTLALERLRIDIDAWIASLPLERQQEARDVITPYAGRLSRCSSPACHFAAPTMVSDDDAAR